MNRIYNLNRRKSRPVKAGRLTIGGDNPVAVQSMANTSTLDTDASASQAAVVEKAGGKLMRFTTQGVREAANLRNIRKAMEGIGCGIPVSADVHFNPKAAFEAATTADKVRINPGNFVDPARTFRKLEFTDSEYASEIERIRQAFLPFLDLCRANGTSIRIGVNHGSLSDRIMSRYGDTPAGMVESAMEYLRIAREADFNDIVISIKASNTVVMTDTVRLLADKMESEGMDYPLHLGVTEAGDAEDGRIKSAVGIGTLLHEGLGDTIRVSLSEPPENEIPVAIMLRDHVAARSEIPQIQVPETTLPGRSRDYADSPDFAHLFPMAATAELDSAITQGLPGDALETFAITDPRRIGEMAAGIDSYVASGGRKPVLMAIAYNCDSLDELRIKAGADFGALLLNGYGSAIKITAPGFSQEQLYRLELDILQAARLRFSKTEYIACPGCGRTLFNLQATLGEVKQAIEPLGIKGLKIGVMGCIVNGPGEMADADYGYVGAGPGRVSIYRRKEIIAKNIPTAEALPRLIALIKENHKAQTE